MRLPRWSVGTINTDLKREGYGFWFPRSCVGIHTDLSAEFATPLLTFYRFLEYVNVSDGVANPVRLGSFMATMKYQQNPGCRYLYYCFFSIFIPIIITDY